jgi:hypothetical protein
MNAEIGVGRPGAAAKALAVASVGSFWLLPFSPLVAIAAISMTAETTGWPRRLARAGAVLCIAYSAALALLMSFAMARLVQTLS